MDDIPTTHGPLIKVLRQVYDYSTQIRLLNWVCPLLEDLHTSVYNQEHVPLYVLRDDEGWIDMVWDGDDLYEADDWAWAIEDGMGNSGWGTDKPQLHSAQDRAGIHDYTGIPYAPSPEQVAEAFNERAECNLYREIRGIPPVPEDYQTDWDAVENEEG